MFFHFTTNIPQLFSCSSEGIELEKHILVIIFEILVAIVSNIGEKGLDVIYLANVQNEAQATTLHTAISGRSGGGGFCGGIISRLQYKLTTLKFNESFYILCCSIN